MKRMIIAGLTLSLLASSLALADPPAWAGHGREGEHRQWHHERDDRRDGRWHHERNERWRRDERYRGERFDADRYREPPDYYRHAWRRGERLPIEYRAPQYIVPNVVVYHLAPPPPGYYWVRVGNRAVLAAIATGVVLDVVNNVFH